MSRSISNILEIECNRCTINRILFPSDTALKYWNAHRRVPIRSSQEPVEKLEKKKLSRDISTVDTAVQAPNHPVGIS